MTVINATFGYENNSGFLDVTLSVRKRPAASTSHPAPTTKSVATAPARRSAASYP